MGRAERILRRQAKEQQRAAIDAQAKAAAEAATAVKRLIPAVAECLRETIEIMAKANYPGANLVYFDDRRGRATWPLFSDQETWYKDGYVPTHYYLCANGDIMMSGLWSNKKVRLTEFDETQLRLVHNRLLELRAALK